MKIIPSSQHLYEDHHARLPSPLEDQRKRLRLVLFFLFLFLFAFLFTTASLAKNQRAAATSTLDPEKYGIVDFATTSNRWRSAAATSASSLAISAASTASDLLLVARQQRLLDQERQRRLVQAVATGQDRKCEERPWSSHVTDRECSNHRRARGPAGLPAASPGGGVVCARRPSCFSTSTSSCCPSRRVTTPGPALW